MGRPKGSTNKPKKILIEVPQQEEVVSHSVIKFVDGKKIIEGWINVYKHIEDRVINYYTGSDIFATPEEAKKIAGKGVLGQFLISVEDR